jgi:hypothetical protein
MGNCTRCSVQAFLILTKQDLGELDLNSCLTESSDKKKLQTTSVPWNRRFWEALLHSLD